MSKFNTVIKDYIKEQVLGVNVDSLPDKFAGLNNATNQMGDLLVGLASELSKTGKLDPKESIELQKFLKPDDTTYPDAVSFLENPQNANLKKIFTEKGLYTPKTNTTTDTKNNPSIPQNNTPSTTTPAKTLAGSAYSSAPKA